MFLCFQHKKPFMLLASSSANGAIRHFAGAGRAERHNAVWCKFWHTENAPSTLICHCHWDHRLTKNSPASGLSSGWQSGSSHYWNLSRVSESPFGVYTVYLNSLPLKNTHFQGLAHWTWVSADALRSIGQPPDVGGPWGPQWDLGIWGAGEKWTVGRFRSPLCAFSPDVVEGGTGNASISCLRLCGNGGWVG
jgi:hypothetical protein